MFKMTITAGIEFDRNGQPVADPIAKLRAINTHIAATFGGYTITRTHGGWINGAGQLVEEDGRQWQVYMPGVTEAEDAHVAARELGELIAAALNQEAVVVAVSCDKAEFVSQPADGNARAIAA